jgi:hypothetical protein
MAGDQPAPRWLDDEQRARIRDCLRKDKLTLPSDRFERFVGQIQMSIDYFLGLPPEGKFRKAHDDLRALWALAREDDPPVGVVRARLQKLTPAAREYVGQRAPRIIARLDRKPVVWCTSALPAQSFCEFIKWTATADGAKLLTAVRLLSAEGARFVAGRSRGGGKRSGIRLEPVIMGEARGVGSAHHRGGRPRGTFHLELVQCLALDWLQTGEDPKPGRSDHGGFGDLVHSVFQWLSFAGRKCHPRLAPILGWREGGQDTKLADFLKQQSDNL